MLKRFNKDKKVCSICGSKNILYVLMKERVRTFKDLHFHSAILERDSYKVFDYYCWQHASLGINKYKMLSKMSEPEMICTTCSITEKHIMNT
jgi:hypothetical protein